MLSSLINIGSSITPPSCMSRKVALNTVEAAVQSSKAAPQNCFIIYGEVKRTRSGDASSGEFRALECMRGFCKRNSEVSVVLGKPGAHNNDSRLASYFNIDAKGILIGLT